MKKFKHPIEAYGVGRKIKPMEVELSKHLSEHRHLAENAIYYYGALIYTGGSLYRAALGYDVLWDRKTENRLILCLDYFLMKQLDESLYYFEELKVGRTMRFHGIPWSKGLAPKTLNFALQWPYELQEGESLTARINLLDKPNHVDIERQNGEIFTIQYVRYQNAISGGNFIKKGRPNEKPRSKSASKPIRTGKTKGLKLVKGVGSQNPAKTLPSQLPSLWQRQRRQNSL